MAHGTGWQIPSGFALADPAGPGEAGYYMHLTPKPTPEHPTRAVVRTPCSPFVGTTPDEARAWLNHPGDHPAMARHYIEWAEGIAR